mgnify:CR=1 FL=1
MTELRPEARRYEEAMRIRLYIEAARASLTEPELIAEEAPEELKDWLAWAEQKADWLDPLVVCSDVILDAPPKQKPSRW